MECICNEQEYDTINELGYVNEITVVPDGALGFWFGMKFQEQMCCVGTEHALSQ